MKIRVGIFMGGYSSEAEISILSGQTVYNSLDVEKFEKYKVVISRDSWLVTDGRDSWPLNRIDLSFERDGKTLHFDVVFNAIHGHPGEDGFMQALLELNHIAHSSCGFFESALTFNKSKTSALAQSRGITIPRARYITEVASINPKELCESFGLPLFIKPNRSGSSFGVSKVNTEDEVLPAITSALKEDHQIVVEEAIIGTEVGCGVVRKNGKTEAIAITEIIPKRAFFDYQAKYEGASEEITPARISDDLYLEISAKSEAIYDYLGLWGVVRIDYIVRDGIPYLIEINSIPGLAPASIIPQQLAYRAWPLGSFFGGLLEESIQHYKK